MLDTFHSSHQYILFRRILLAFFFFLVHNAIAYFRREINIIIIFLDKTSGRIIMVCHKKATDYPPSTVMINEVTGTDF